VRTCFRRKWPGKCCIWPLRFSPILYGRGYRYEGIYQEHAHGGCNPLANLTGHDIDAILVGGIGAGAINKLNAAVIRVHLASNGTVADNIDRYTSGQLPELTLEDGCRHHGGCDDH